MVKTTGHVSSLVRRKRKFGTNFGLDCASSCVLARVLMATTCSQPTSIIKAINCIVIAKNPLEGMEKVHLEGSRRPRGIHDVINRKVQICGV
jgi:hypothetical protein